MHVMVATDGTVDAKKAAAIAAKLAADGGQVTVFTVIEIPRDMLNEMRTAGSFAADEKAREVSVPYRKSQAESEAPPSWAGDDAIIERYVKSKVDSRTSELAAELTAAGVDHTVEGVEGENAARTVLEAAKARDVDVICIGALGLGRFEGLLGSLSTKVSRHADCSVVLVR